jgi:hypothetical protein
VISLNLKRRHLNDSQRAMAAARLANMPVGNPGGRDDATGKFTGLPNSADMRNRSDTPQVSQVDAAVMLNVGVRLVTSAAKIQQHGSDGLIKAVDIGAITVTVADPLSEMDEETRPSGLGRLSAKFYWRLNVGALVLAHVRDFGRSHCRWHRR